VEDTPANMNLSPQQKQELVSATIGQVKFEQIICLSISLNILGIIILINMV